MMASEETKFEGDELPIEEAIDQIAGALCAAKNPLVVGLENLSTESQRAAMKLAMLCKATVDCSSDDNGRGNMFAMQKRGRVSATLGEIKSRSNLVLFWYCDPAFVVPEVFEFLRVDGQRIAVNCLPTETQKYATETVEIPQRLSTSALWLIRSFVENKPTRLSAGQETELPIAQLLKIAESLKQSTYSAIVWGSDERDPQCDIQADGIHSLIRSLNNHTRCVGLPFRVDQNGLSAENVSTWSTGFPFAVNLNRGQPRQHWLEYSDTCVSERDEWDVLLAFELGYLTVASKRIDGRSAFQMQIPVGGLGDTETGTACRMDDIALEVVAAQESDLISTAKIIELISNSMKNV